MFVLMFAMSRAPGAPAGRSPGLAPRPARGGGEGGRIGWAAGLQDRRSCGNSQPHSRLVGDNAHEAENGNSKVVLKWLGYAWLQISCAWMANIVCMEK